MSHESRVKVYVAGPISGDVIANVKAACRVAADLIRRGYSVLCPHLSGFVGFGGRCGTGGLPEVTPCGTPHRQWLDNDLPWVECADVVLRLPGESKGADVEVAHAEKHGIPVVYDVDDLPDPMGCDGNEVVSVPSPTEGWRFFVEEPWPSEARKARLPEVSVLKPGECDVDNYSPDGSHWRTESGAWGTNCWEMLTHIAALPGAEKSVNGNPVFREVTEDGAASILRGRRPWRESEPDGREHFPTGSVRDTREGKGWYDLISPVFLRRLAKHYENGVKKYGDRNWERGQPAQRYIDSAIRHIVCYQAGQRDEDHLAAAAWNLGALTHTEESIAAGTLPKELDDFPYATEADSE